MSTQWESHKADAASNNASNNLSENYKDTINDGWSASDMSVFNHHRDGDSGIKMSSTDWAENLSHDKDGQTGAVWGT